MSRSGSREVKQTWIFIYRNLACKALRCDTCYTRDHIVLPATKHEPNTALTPQPQRTTARVRMIVQKSSNPKVSSIGQYNHLMLWWCDSFQSVVSSMNVQ